jgi:hypothetical protein
MVSASQIETRSSFAPPSAPIEPVQGVKNDDARDSAKPENARNSSGVPSQSEAHSSESAYSVDISVEAQRATANNPGAVRQAGEAPDQQPAPPQGLNKTSGPSATAESTAVGAASDSTAETNQVTSFVSERTGNDTNNQTEAGRTLGQVIDTFA